MKQILIVCLAAAVVVSTGCGAMRTADTTQAPTGPTVAATTAAEGMIPAGTQMVIRTDEAIEADKPMAGKTFSATVAEEVQDRNGQTLIPRGSPAELTVASTQGGAVAGDQLVLALQSVTINGQRRMITSDPIQRGDDESIGANRRTATMVGGGALLGTLVGAVAGGASGAAVGAAVGAAGGAAAQVLTRGDRINVPAESVLTFRLDQPLQLQGAGAGTNNP